MEGALGERLKREYYLTFDEDVVMASLPYLERGRHALRELWSGYRGIAREHGLPFLATTTTRRVNRERVTRSHYEGSIVRDNVIFLREVLASQADGEAFAGGLLGCRGDAYTGQGAIEDADEARRFHEWEVSLFADAGVDFLYAALMPTAQEALGMALAVAETKIPYLVSFTIAANGCLVDGTRICDAIRLIDGRVDPRPTCYMTNCVHPTIAYAALARPFNRCEDVRERFLGIQANTSALPYGELDEARELLTSEPGEFADQIVQLRELCPIKIFGGCCGTDDRHMKEIADRIAPR